MINNVTLIGYVGQDPEIRTTETGTTVARVSIATNESYQDKNGEWQTLTEWHNVIMWREMGESAVGKLKKGMLVFVEGKIKSREYTGTDGIKRYATDIIAAFYRKLEKSDNSHKFPHESTDSIIKEQIKENTLSNSNDTLPF